MTSDPTTPGGEPAVLVPRVATEAMLRPFYDCPADELPLAWQAMLAVVEATNRRAALAASQAASHSAHAEPVADEKDANYWVRFWLRAALDCKEFHWDADQKELAEMALAIPVGAETVAPDPDGERYRWMRNTLASLDGVMLQKDSDGTVWRSGPALDKAVDAAMVANGLASPAQNAKSTAPIPCEACNCTRFVTVGCESGGVDYDEELPCPKCRPAQEPSAEPAQAKKIGGTE